MVKNAIYFRSPTVVVVAPPLPPLGRRPAGGPVALRGLQPALVPRAGGRHGARHRERAGAVVAAQHVGAVRALHAGGGPVVNFDDIMVSRAIRVMV